jgi:hypothetical protein
VMIKAQPGSVMSKTELRSAVGIGRIVDPH